jgi:peptidoglycan/xylan/chitin deacetylase (PgdA/CDA1 family)
VQATFFVWGEQAEAHPGLVRAALDAGHSVQPHCWSHRVSHPQMTPNEIRDDIDRVLWLLGQLGAPAPRLWRPPWGEWLPDATDLLAVDRGLDLNGWTIDSGDWIGTAASAMYAAVCTAVHRAPGAPASVLLMHDGPRESGQWARRKNVDETVELVRLLCADRSLSVGPQREAVPDGLNPPPL